MKTYTYGTTPTDVIRAALDAQCPEGYHISAWPRSEDYQALVAAVNQGIDSHLEAVTGMKQGTDSRGSPEFTFTTDDMLVILRRLGESDDDNAMFLRSCILETLGIEEV